MGQSKRVVVTGGGGFIGHHLISYLVDRGYWVRGVDIKEPEYEATRAHEFRLLDLCRLESCLEATRNIDEVYGLAANMGGIGFIESNKALIVRDNTLINIGVQQRPCPHRTSWCLDAYPVPGRDAAPGRGRRM